MRAIIIGAGRGRRLMPTTADTPKCFAEVQGKRILDWTLDALGANGIEDVCFIGGYRIETVRGDGRIDGADPSLASLAGTIEVRFADQTLLDQALNGAPAEIEFTYSAGPAASFTLTAHAVYLPRPRLALQGPGGVQASFAWQAARDPVLGRMATATLINDLDSYDNPNP